MSKLQDEFESGRTSGRNTGLAEAAVIVEEVGVVKFKQGKDEEAKIYRTLAQEIRKRITE